MYDEQKKQSLETDRLRDQQRKRMLEDRQKNKEKKAQETLKKHSTGGNKGQAQQAIRSAKNLAKSMTPLGAVSLLSQIRPADLVYFLALMAAILKDILDFSEATGVGYALVVVTTFLTSIFIGFMMILASFSDDRQGSQRINRKIIRSWLILIGGTAAELLFGLNIIPIETFSVLLIFFLALSARKEIEK